MAYWPSRADQLAQVAHSKWHVGHLWKQLLKQLLVAAQDGDGGLDSETRSES